MCVVGWYVLQYICERCGGVLGMFCSKVIAGAVVGWYVLQYICERCGSLLGMFCSTVITGVCSGLVCSAVYL